MQDPGKNKGISLEENQRTVKKQGKSYLLGIGIDQYLAFPKLHNAVKDVEDFIQVLEAKYELDEVMTVFDKEATRDHIIDHLERLIDLVRPEDKLIIYYSGHGHLNKQQRGFWIPYDAQKGNTSRYISNSRIRDYINDIPASHTLLISDSCFSGSLFARVARSSSEGIAKDLEQRISRWAICSGRHDEVVADGKPGENSPFAASLIDILQYNSSAFLKVQTLADRVMEQTRYNYKEQLPEGNPLYGVGHKGGQYIFRLKAGVADAWEACQKEGTLAAYQTFLVKYRDSQFADDARKQLAFLEEELAWEAAKRSHTVHAYYDYDRKYPAGRYSNQAWELIKELEEAKAWKEATTRHTLFAYRKYMTAYPQGKFAKEAEGRIKQLIEQDEQGSQPSSLVGKTPTTKVEPKKKIPSPKPKPIDDKPPLISVDTRDKIATGIVALVVLSLAIWLVSSLIKRDDNPEELTEQVTTPKPSDEEKKVQGLSSNEDKSNTSSEMNTPEKEENPAIPPPKPTLSHFIHDEFLRVDIANGSQPYILRLIHNGRVKYDRTIYGAGPAIINLEEYRKDPGTYVIEVIDAKDQKVKKSIKIDPPKEKPVIPPPKPTLSHSSQGETLRIDIANGSQPYTLKLMRNDRVQYEKIIIKAGRININLEEYRKDPGTYVIEVIDAKNQIVKKSIKIDPPKENLATPPPKPTLSHSFRGETLRVDIANGSRPYTLELIRNGRVKYEKRITKAGRISIKLEEYRKDAGTYVIEVSDAKNQKAKKSIRIDPPKEKPIASSNSPSTTVASKIMKDGRRWTTKNLNINVQGSYCYDNKNAHCTKYGRLYTWEAAKAACKKIGNGWRLPTDKEWRNMAKQYGGEGEDANDLGKAAYKALIKGGNSGFGALLGGSYGYGFEGEVGYYWSSTENSAGQPWGYYFDPAYGGSLYRDWNDKPKGFSCRCIQD